MSFKALSTCALLVISALSAIASPVELDARDEAVTYVNTPGGPRPQSQVHHVPDGASILHTTDAVHIISESGEILHTNAISNAEGLASRTIGQFSPSHVVEPRAISTGYVAYTYFTNNSVANPISSFSSSWTVPPVPKTNHNQLLYLFSALTPVSDDAILQPVLQYGTSGAGGGNYWATASWYLVGASTYHTTLVPVSTGATMNGVLTLQKTFATAGGTTYQYNAQFTHSPYTTITVNTTEQLNWAWEALEIYSAQVTTDLPTGTTPFSNITMMNLNGQYTPLEWSTRNDTTDGFSAQVKVNGSPAGEIEIVY
ncbi:hypothetical protein BDZ97DRAFT_1758342 [Flammula alnicola]|nr:hypothetical protein BDZ97DRAFT_1766323 [Flammula alnicola]KAF8963720.1 hypothetical protein BDZ97DRAFT_1758342 [Flammula alnicola]